MHTSPVGYTARISSAHVFPYHYQYVILTVRMPHLTQELHGRWCQWVVFWEFELGWKYAAFERCAFWSLYECFPDEDVVFIDWARCDAVWWVHGEVLVLGEEAAGGYGSCHGLR